MMEKITTRWFLRQTDYNTYTVVAIKLRWYIPDTSTTEQRTSPELLLNPAVICRNEAEKCLIETSINSVRISLKIFIDESRSFSGIEEKARTGYGFLQFDRTAQELHHVKLCLEMPSLVSYLDGRTVLEYLHVKCYDKEISELKMSVNTRGRLVATFLLLCSSTTTSATDLHASSTATDFHAREAEALVKWKDSLDNETQSFLSSWKLLPRSSNSSFNLSMLTYLDLSVNQFSGNIPNEICPLSSLQVLYLDYNDLNDFIPHERGMLKFVAELFVSSNNLSGSIPTSIGNKSMFTGNKISGSIPPEIGLLRSLQELYMDKNFLTGSFPPSLGNSSNLIFLNIGHNKLTSSIPREIGQLKSIEQLHLYEDNLSGSIPSSIGKLNSLTHFDLSFNNITVLFIHQKIRRNSNEPGESGALRNDGKKSWSIWECLQKSIVNWSSCSSEKTPQECGPAIHEAFANENSVLTRAGHRKIVKFHGFCSHTRHLFLVNEFTERGSLLKILGDEVKALGFEWAKWVNVVKDHISDFGSARTCDPESSNWTSFAGTFGYSAPDLAYTMEVNEKINMSSLGVVALEVVMGKHPGDLISFWMKMEWTKKNELRDEKLVLKVEKERMEQQLKAPAIPPGFMPARPAAYQNKMPMFPSYGMYPMWH
ncbi:hypothetical protein FNV43_RR01245 [Rhamnella rubrinervis]|uniref:non-specific serine/threonine protein kinase n=1 Tax=Rhamnella rubrinervis TaxID=2594499 RepID=A0A8K0MRV9_9ROSA|nr:hypothetical protein FNV43_RR01245 [Rhamnella rubrinervis]